MPEPVRVGRVLLASGVFPPELGGPALQTRDLVRVLASAGVEARVFTWQHPDRPPQQHVIEVARGDVGRRFRRWWSVGMAASRAITAFRPDIVHVQTAGGPLPLAVALAARFHRVPCVIKYASDADIDSRTRGRRTARIRRLGIGAGQRLAFRMATRVWATSEAFNSRAVTRFGVPMAHVVVYPNFRDLTIFREAAADAEREQPTRTVACITRLLPRKRVADLIEAAALLKDLELVVEIVGEGDREHQEMLEARAQTLGLGARVRFLGPMDEHDVAKFLARATCLVLPSEYEPFGIVLIEAMAAGTPVIATAVGGVPSIVDSGATGLLVPPRDPPALAAAIRRVLMDDDLARRLQVAGELSVERFDVHGGATWLLSLWTDLASGRAPTGRA